MDWSRLRWENLTDFDRYMIIILIMLALVLVIGIALVWIEAREDRTTQNEAARRGMINGSGRRIK